MKATVVAGLALLCGLAPALDAQETISTDRPGLALSTATVPSGAVQLEVGAPAVGLTSDRGTTVRVTTIPSLIRAGLAHGLELRIGSPVYTSTRVRVSGAPAQTTGGFGGIELGAKFSGSVGHTAFAVIPSAILPVGDQSVTGTRTAYTLNTVASWSLPAGIGATGLLGGELVPSGARGYSVAGAAVGAASRALGSRTGGYFEAGWYPTENGGDPAYIGAGVTWLATPAFQLDGFFDRGLTGASADWLFGLGAAIRL
jgi:hypothetical protein